MESSLKTTIRIGDAELSAEGSEEAVHRLLDRFEQMLPDMATEPAKQLDDGSSTLAKTRIGNGAVSGKAQAEEEPGRPDQALLDRAFALDDRTGLSLRALPRGDNREADAVLLLLYGFATLRGEHNVLAGQIVRSAGQSGITVERVDRTLAPYEELVTRSGRKSGSRYGLNNRGLVRAGELLEGLLN